MSISQVEEIIGKDEYSELLLYGKEHKTYQLSNILKVSMSKIKMLSIDCPTKIIHLDKFTNLSTLLIEFEYFLNNKEVYNLNLSKFKKIQTIIFNNVPSVLKDIHKTFLISFINNLPQTLETLVVNIKNTPVDHDFYLKNYVYLRNQPCWTLHDFSYISNLPFCLKYFIIFIVDTKLEYKKRFFLHKKLKVPFNCKILYSINYIHYLNHRTKNNIIILDEYIED
jgi:hypothetical protein